MHKIRNGKGKITTDTEDFFFFFNLGVLCTENFQENIRNKTIQRIFQKNSTKLLISR